MQTQFKAALIGLTLATASMLSMAQAAAPAGAASTPGIDQRQANQEKRIDQGVASGQLNKRETRRLQREQNAIDRAENRAKADGTVTAKERRQLHRAQNHASHDIARQKHDRQRRAASAPGS
jgi:polyhydroxyalkanoate synthesis regulator phasin